MGDTGTSVTLIFYKVGPEWWKEPALNLLAAAAQFSSYTHVEISIGETVGHNGMMANVARIFNDATGVEICERTGRNPQYTYQSLGCSKAAEQRMLTYARAQKGKPFSNMGMARSLVWPRASDGKTFYCAELVAAILKQGGLMSSDSNPGAATPYSLYKLYSKQAAATANPYTLRQVGGLNLQGLTGVGARPLTAQDRVPLCAQSPQLISFATAPNPGRTIHESTGGSARRRSDSPPRAPFKLVAVGRAAQGQQPGLTLSLTSLRS